MKYLDIMKLPRGHVRTTQLGILRDSFPDAVVGGEDENNGMIRFDMKLPLITPTDKPRELWLDHAIVQETCPTYAMETLKFLEAKSTNLPEQSPAFVKTNGTKARRYSALIQVVRRLAEERMLHFQPEFLFPIISSLGYINEDMTQLMKLMVKRFKDYQIEQPKRLDGLVPGILKGRFKVSLRNSICFALARANALTLENQGVYGVVQPR